MNPYTPPNEQSNQSTHRTQDVRTTASRWVTFLNWFSVVSLPAFLLTIFVGLGFALGPLRTSYNSPIRGLSLLFSTVCLFAGPFITAYMIRRNLLQKQVLWILPQAIAAAVWAVVAYCLIGGIMGIHQPYAVISTTNTYLPVARNHRITKGCTRSTHSGGCEVVSFSFVPGEPGRYLA